MPSLESSFFGTVSSGFNNMEVQIQWQDIKTPFSIFFPIKIVVTFRYSSRNSTLLHKKNTHPPKKKTLNKQNPEKKQNSNNQKNPQTTTTKAEITFFGFYLASEKQYFVQKKIYTRDIYVLKSVSPGACEACFPTACLLSLTHHKKWWAQGEKLFPCTVGTWELGNFSPSSM